MSRRRVAILGGSFDPVHNGHCLMATTVLRQNLADEVWLMVSPCNPLKEGLGKTPEEVRLQMVRLACRDIDGMKPCDIEFGLPKPSYTAETLRTLRERFPDTDFRLVIGSDNWLVFNRWREPEAIIGNAGVIVYQRPDYPVPNGFKPLASMPPGWEDNVTVIAGVPLMLVSSTYIRELARNGKQLDFLVPDAVADYIAKRKVYN